MDPQALPEKYAILKHDVENIRKGFVGRIVESYELLSGGYKYGLEGDGQITYVHSDSVHLLAKSFYQERSGYTAPLSVVNVFRYLGNTTDGFVKNQHYKSRYHGDHAYNEHGDLMKLSSKLYHVLDYDEDDYKDTVELFNQGDVIRVHPKAYLVNKHGVLPNGTPKTKVQFSYVGSMDKFFGATARFNGYILESSGKPSNDSTVDITFDDPELESSMWAFSADMFELATKSTKPTIKPTTTLDDIVSVSALLQGQSQFPGSIDQTKTVTAMLQGRGSSVYNDPFAPVDDRPTAPKTVKKYRDFLPFVTEYDSISIWKELVALAKKEKAGDHVPADLFVAWCNRSDESFKDFICSLQSLDMEIYDSSTLKKMLKLSKDYSIDTQLSFLLYKFMHMGADDKGRERVKQLRPIIKDEALLQELDGANLFTVISRQSTVYCRETVDAIFKQFNIVDSEKERTQILSQDMVRNILVDALLKKLEEDKAHSLSPELVIEVEI